MKKSYLILAAAAIFAACSSDDGLTEQQAPQAAANDGAVAFDAYVIRGTSRAGADGILTTSTTSGHSIDLQTKGFGVFAYYTNGEPYSGITKPNFMYNQLVKYEGAAWKYDPVKYWPNEFGEDAISDQVDRVTFFAYAPWVEVNGLTGVVTTDATNNITGMTRNTATGDPFIKYSATMDANNSVDLCYGVAAEDFTSSNSIYNPNNIAEGEPYLNVVKPGLTGKINYNFKHALAQLNVTIDAVVNGASPTTSALNSANTRIWVRSVSFEGVTQKGSLNLNGGEWYDVNGNNKITSGTLTVYDGRKDGKEANDAASNEIPQTLNSALVQNAAYTISGTPATITSTLPTGVTETEVNLFNASDNDDPVFIIPTGEKMKVTIVYDVETYDPSLAFYLSDGSTPGSTIENTISKTIDAFGYIEAGKKYILKLHLGMRSVDFEAAVAEWTDKTIHADLPSNLPVYIAGNPGAVTLAANVYSYEFAVSGLTSGETTTGNGTGNVSAVTSNAANTSGVAVNTATITPNTTTNKVSTNTIVVTPASTAATTITVTQLPAALGMSASELAASGTTITITPTATGTDFDYADITTNGEIIITRARGGATTTLTQAATPTAGEYNIVDATGTGTITLGDAALTGDIYTITIKMNDAAAETVTVIVQ